MENYNYIVELVVLPIILTVMISLRKDCYSEISHYKFLNRMYRLAFYSSLSTVVTYFFNDSLGSNLAVICGYIANTLHFILLPGISVMFSFYIRINCTGALRKSICWRKYLVYLVPYALYLIFVFINIVNGWLFTITQRLGYARGPLFMIPYPVIILYVGWIAFSIITNIKFIPREFVNVILVSSITGILIIMMLIYNNTIILTGLLNTMCILVVHLTTLSNGKKEDILTGVQNRFAFLYRISKQINAKKAFSVYVISVRETKYVNEQYGLNVGDKKLFNIARILLNHVRRERIFRYSGDEFAIILPYHEEEMLPVIKEIMQEFKNGTKVDGSLLPIDAEVVRVDYPNFGVKVGDLIAIIDYGIRTLKEQKGNSNGYLYDIGVSDTMRKHNSIMNELNSAIKEHRFEVHYQPIYNLHKDKFTQAEALIRMRKQDDTLIYPNDFIDIANDTGIIVDMTYQLLDQVCCDLRTLFDEQPNNTLKSVSINVPYIQFTKSDMEECFMQILDKYQILPSQIKIEVTERTMIEDIDMMREKMNRLMAKGFEFELDDFGTGYSNLQMIISFPMQIIKLDRSILLTALASKMGLVFFKNILSGIHSTKRKMLIEGVETQEQLDWAKNSNCEYVQGYYFSKPVNFEKFVEFVRD